MALLERFGRIVTPGRRLIPQIDGLRFVAIASVFYYHIAHWLPVAKAGFGGPDFPLAVLMTVGRYGVELFFVISGFVLALPFVRARLGGGKPVSLRAYFLRRLTRLEPPYLLLLLAAFVIRVLAGENTASELWPHLLAGMIYQHNNIYGEMNPVMGASWSLEVEVQFYTLTPILTGIFLLRRPKLRRGLLLLLILSCGFVRYYISSWRYYTCVFGHLHEFFAGYLLADLYVVDWREQPRESYAWDIVSLLAWTAIWPLVLYEDRVFPVLPLVVFAAYCGALRGPLSRRLFGNPWLVVIGGMCYTIYLAHGPIIDRGFALGMRVLPAFEFNSAFLLWSVLLTVPGLVISTILFAHLERPCMNPTWPSLLAARVRGWVRRS
jgi:peptidoglycan/LPS O-acetylase OafA/YrhL